MKSIILMMICIIGSSSLMAREIINYSNMPVTINLSVGNERSIDFGSHVKVGMTKGQQALNLFRIQSAEGVIHIRPNIEFENQRIQVKRIEDGKVFLLDLYAKKKGGSFEVIQIVTESAVDESEANKLEMIKAHKSQQITPIELTRYAAQVLYGPKRLMPSNPYIKQKNLNQSNQYSLFKNEERNTVKARPIIEFSTSKYKMICFLLSNQSNEEIKLNYLNLNVPFEYATFQHHKLERAQLPGDKTVLYLIVDTLANSTHGYDYFSNKTLQSLYK